MSYDNTAVREQVAHMDKAKSIVRRMSNSQVDLVYRNLNLRVYFDYAFAEKSTGWNAGIDDIEIIAPCDDDWNESSANLVDILNGKAQQEISAMIMRREIVR